MLPLPTNFICYTQGITIPFPVNTQQKLLIAGGLVILVFLVLLIVLTSQPNTKTQTPQNTAPQGEPTEPVNQTRTTQRDSFQNPDEPDASPTPYKRYTFEGIAFSIPDTWKVEASPRTGSLLAQPVEAKDVFSLPRLQINVENTASPDYIPYKEVHSGRTADANLPARNRLVVAAYRDLRPLAEEDNTTQVQNIQERLAILRNNSREYTVYFQYAGTGRNDDLEDLYASVIESLSYQ